jgi:hypothetical protein
MKSNQVLVSAAVAVVLGIGLGYLMGRPGGQTDSNNATVDCKSGRSIGAIVQLKGTPLAPDALSLDKKFAYVDLLRDFWTRRLSVIEEFALVKLSEGAKNEVAAEPNEAAVTALYEANKKAFPVTMKKEEILNNLRQMLRSQNKYRADAERRIKAVKEGALTYSATPACGPKMAEIRALPGGDGANVLMVGSFFCPECRGNFGYVDRWIEEQGKANIKVPFGHLAVATSEDGADFVMARAELCVQKNFAEKVPAFLRALHRVPTQASVSALAAEETLKNLIKEVAVDEAVFKKCYDDEGTVAAIKKRVELFKGMNVLSANVLLYKDRPVVMRRDRPEEIPNVISALVK